MSTPNIELFTILLLLTESKATLLDDSKNCVLKGVDIYYIIIL